MTNSGTYTQGRYIAGYLICRRDLNTGVIESASRVFNKLEDAEAYAQTKNKMQDRFKFSVRLQ